MEAVARLVASQQANPDLVVVSDEVYKFTVYEPGSEVRGWWCGGVFFLRGRGGLVAWVCGWGKYTTNAQHPHCFLFILSTHPPQ